LGSERQKRDDATRHIAGKFALRGHAKSHTLVSSDQKPYCDDPVRIYRQTDPKSERRTIEVSFWAPCRKCEKCLQYRQLKWRDLALAEIQRSNRSWFVTLTFSPVHLVGVEFESLKCKGRDKMAQVDQAAYRHCQRYIKRLRKAGAVFRYLAVFELGEKTDRPHYHLLLHETGARPILKRTIEDNWRSHVHARLVAKGADGAASYITKYATKSLSVRLRSSQAYGK